MPTWSSDAGFQKAPHGFTLLELMMVLLLIGLMAGAGLALDFSGGKASPQEQAELLAQQFRLASLEAVQSGNVWGLDFFRLVSSKGESGTGYRWLFNDGKRWREADPRWLDAKRSETVLPMALQLRLAFDGVEVDPELQQALVTARGAPNAKFSPEVLLQPTREFTAFTAQLCQGRDAACDAAVSVDALGRVTVKTGAN